MNDHLENRIDEPHDHRLARERTPSRAAEKVDAQTVHQANQADAAWERLEELRGEAIEMGISVDLTWPIAALETKIRAARTQG